MLAVLGDLHGEWGFLQQAISKAYKAGASAIIQLGDFGIYPDGLAGAIHIARKSPIPIYFIDGNHEDYRIISEWNRQLLETGESIYHVVKDRLMYVRRGTVLTLDGRCLALLGGAGSIDKDIRIRQGGMWHPEEQIEHVESQRMQSEFDKVGRVDFFLTHCPPQEIITSEFDNGPGGLLRRQRTWGVGPEWFDPSAHRIEFLWRVMNCPPIYSGHMHATIQKEQVRILNIGEIAYI